MTTQPKTKDKLTFSPAESNEKVHSAFVSAIAAPAEGANAPHVAKFVQVAEVLITTQRTVCLQDFTFALRAFDIPRAEIEQLFNVWTTKMIQFRKLEPLQSCYDGEIYLVI
jgi:hypothetical protein